MTLNIHMEDLICPITLEYLELPISLPCCGRAISKLPLVQHLENSDSCPLCRSDLSNFDAVHAPISVNLSYMVEKLQKIDPVIDNCIGVKVCRVPMDNTIYKTTIGQLQITSTSESIFKHLFIIVVDKSGSMGGNPMLNVRYSLNRIIDSTYKHPHLITQIITYDDRSTNFEIKRTDPIIFYQNTVNQLNAGGGTSFRSAFESIERICREYSDRSDVSSISILFLTDGEDSVPKDKRGELIIDLKTNLDKIIMVDYIVHTIGFGGSHDFEFLNGLKEIGTNPGAYRFADPSESTDVLSNKINSILDVVVTANVIPIKIISSELKIIGSVDSNTYWVNLTKCDLGSTYKVVLEINGDEPIELEANIINPIEQIEIDKLQSKWYMYLIDEIASEVLAISISENSLDRSLHIELVSQRSKAILARLEESDPNKIRCLQLLDMINLIKSGEKVSQLKLTDIKFEGKYATAPSTKSVVNPVRLITPSIPSISTSSSYKPAWDTIPIIRSGRCRANKYSPIICNVMAHYRNDEACHWIRNNIDDVFVSFIVSSVTTYPLIVGTSIGRLPIVRELLSVGADPSDTNSNNFNAIDTAILYGYDRTLDILAQTKVKPTLDGQLLLQTCISNRYFRTASKLIKYGFANITDSMIDAVPTIEGANWLSSNSNRIISIETAITKGMWDKVEEQINSINKLSWVPYLDVLLIRPTNPHIKIIRLLLEKSKLDPNEVWDSLNDADIEWPLFLASKNGLVDIVDILLEYQPIINNQNKKGTTCLWIASCNKHIDITMKLLIAGADPNLANLKGDGPLIPCCQKGSDQIANLLLEGGAKLTVYNINRDNPIIICCRVGQAKILDMCLKQLSDPIKREILSTCADIDGFNPLLAAAEQDRTKCIECCIAHGADIEFKTDELNQILPGATALHIASYYGRLSTIKTLCELGANPLAQTTKHGYSILHIAIKQSHKNVVAFIMDKYKQCTSIPDFEGRLPIFYAKMTGNEDIMAEFFTNRLVNLIGEIIYADQSMEKKCADILLKYGQSISCYEFDQITQIDVGQLDILSASIIGNKQYLIQSLITMNLSSELPVGRTSLCSEQKINPMAIFWAQYLKLNQDQLVPDDSTNLMIDRVHNSSGKNLQNKMLINLDSNLPKLLEQITNPIVKMSNGYDIKLKSDITPLLKKSQLVAQTILGFIEKLKNMKMHNSDSKSYIQYLLSESKIHTIRLIAEGELELQPVHLMTLYLYTADFTIYQQVNQTLFDWDKNSVWHPFVYTLNQAINLISPFVGEVYRAIDYPFVQTLEIGSTFVSDTFSTGSTEWGHCTELINKKKGMIFIINSQTGRSISPYSRYPANSEIIFLPGSIFTVTDLFVGNIFVLGQANIRKTSYRASNLDITKALNSEMCMIVELEEKIEK